MSTIQETIEQAVESWPGVEKLPHRFGGVEFRVKGHEIGHLHGSRQADLPFTVREREELVASGRASVHHVLPRTGWVTYSLHGPESVPALIELFRMNYERYSRPAASSQVREEVRARVLIVEEPGSSHGMCNEMHISSEAALDCSSLHP